MIEILEVLPAIIILAVIMILGFIGNFIFNRTQIPSIVWLLVFGLVLGFIFNVRDGIGADSLGQISNFFGAVAIAIILFDGGINTDLHKLFRGAPRGLLLTVAGFCLSLLGTMAVIIALAALGVIPISIEHSVLVGVLLGSMIGGTSSPIVIPLACRLKNLQEKTKMALSIESIITDPLSIVVFLALFLMISSNILDFSVALKNLVSTFSVGIVLGIIAGLIWLPVMHKLQKEQFSYVLTLAVVFLVYSLTASIVGLDIGGTGAGAISCLVFGLVLGNGKKILNMLKFTSKRYEMDEATKQFHSLISFIMRTFFFVYLGVVVGFQKVEYILIGVVIVAVLLIVRNLSILISTFNGGFEKDDKQTMAVIMPRGLAAAILALSFGPKIVEKLQIQMSGFFTDVSFVVILGTAIICTIGVSIISHAEMKKLKDIDKSKYEAIDDILAQQKQYTQEETEQDLKPKK